MDTVDCLHCGTQPHLGSSAFGVNKFLFHSPSNAGLNPYYDNIKPLLSVLRAMGVMPVSPTAEGKHRYIAKIITRLGIS
jgi:hypothetical protein